MRSPHVQLIDAGGLLRFASSAPAGDLIGDPVAHAVTQLGWVEITQEPDAVRVRMSPGIVAEPALHMARLILSATGLPVSYVLAQTAGWRRATHNCDSAINWIDRLAAARGSAGRLTVTPLSADALFRGRDTGLLAAWQRYKTAPTKLDLAGALAIVHADISGRSGLVERTSDGRLIFRAIGSAVRHHTPEVIRSKIGREIMVDSDYHAACLKSFRDIGTTPQIADVHGIVINEASDPVDLGQRILRVPLAGIEGETFIATTFAPRMSVAA